MYRKIEDFERDWKYEVEQTTTLLKNLTDESLSQKATEDGRELGFLTWHMTQTMEEMLKLTGLEVDAPGPEAECPSNATDIVAAFEIGGNSVLAEVKGNWSDEILEKEDEMYGNKWKRGLTLLYLMLHQAHHRGQITLLMRQAGLKVVGIYGPAKEEWEEQGMPPMK